MTIYKDAMDKTPPQDFTGKPAQPAKEAHHQQAHGDRMIKQYYAPQCSESCLDDALNAYAQAMEETPDSPLLNSRMSRVFFMKGQYDRAVAAAKKALTLAAQADNSHPENRQARSEAHFIQGMIQARQGQLRPAEKLLHTASREAGLRSARIRFALFQAYRDQAMDALWNPRSVLYGAKAIGTLISSLVLLPFEPDRLPFAISMQLLPQLLMAWVMEETRRDEAALQRYLEIAANFPGLASAGLVIGDILREKGELAKARYWFKTVIQRHPANLDAHYHLAQVLEQEENYAEMAEVYQCLNRLKPNDPHINCNLANAYYYMQDYKQALSYYETALQLGKEPVWKGMVAQSIGNIYFDYLQNSQAALAYYQMARHFDPKDVENYVQIGMIYFQNDDHPNAELVYRKALTIAPENPKLYSNLGYLRWLEGDATGAIELYEKAISLDCGYEIPINNMGVIYLDMLGDVHRAIEHFKQAIALDENYSLAYYNLGRAYSFLDNRLEAAQCFQMAQELNQFSRDLDNDELAERIQRLFEPYELELRE
jgi:tetratricopeptide (TPR) repeat protein